MDVDFGQQESQTCLGMVGVGVGMVEWGLDGSEWDGDGGGVEVGGGKVCQVCVTGGVVDKGVVSGKKCG